jgi:hypothetical protein
MRSPRPRRLTWALTLLLWLGAVCWYWQAFVPLRPDHVIRLNHERNYVFQGEPGQLLVAGVVVDVHGGISRTSCIGPLDVIDSHTGRVIGSHFDDGDHIVAIAEGPAPRAAVRRSGVIRVVDLKDGETLSEWQDTGTLAAAFVASSRVLLLTGHGTLRAHDVDTGNVRWSLDGVSAELADIPVNATRIAVRDSKDGRPHPGTDGWYLLDLETGEVDPRFPREPAVLELVESPDHELVMIHHSADFEPWTTVHEAGSGELLWTLGPSERPNVRFSADGTQILWTYRATPAQVGVARWNAADGTMIEALPARRGIMRGFLVGDSQFAVVERMGSSVPEWLRDGLRWLKIKVPPSIDQAQSVIHVLDIKRQSSCGSLARQLWPGRRFWPDGTTSGFVALRPFALDCYSLPPRRNWLWLFG